MADFGDMIDRIDDELNKGGTLDDQIGSAILSAILHYRARRFFFNESELDLSNATTTGDAYITYPTNFVNIDGLSVDDGNGYYPLEKKSLAYLNEIDAGSTETGAPLYYCEQQNQIRLWPTPDLDTYDFKVYGLIDLGTLSVDADTNAWMTDGEGLIRQRAKAIVSIDILRDPVSRQEASVLAMTPRGKGCLSVMEKSALEMLLQQTNKRKTRGYGRERCI